MEFTEEKINQMLKEMREDYERYNFGKSSTKRYNSRYLINHERAQLLKFLIEERKNETKSF